MSIKILGKRAPLKRRAFAPVLCLVMSAAGGTAFADTADPVTLFVDVMGDKLGTELQPNQSSAGDPNKQIDLGGVPLILGAKDSDHASQGVTAGANGSYDLPISGDFSLVSHGTFSKTHYLDAGLIGTTALSGDSQLQYQRGDLTIGLRPDLGFAFNGMTLDQLNYSINSNMSTSLPGGLVATIATTYGRQTIDGSDSLTTSGNTSLSYAFPGSVKIDVNYVFQHATGGGDGDRQGPSLTATIPVGSDIDLAARYCFTQVAGNRLADLRPNQDSTQTLGLTADWDIGAPLDADVKLKASYDYTRDTAAAAGQTQIQHAATVGMAMKF